MARVTGNLELDGTTVKLNQGATTSQSLVAGSPSVASQVRLPNETDANTEVVTTFSNNTPSKRVKFDTSAASANTTLTISSAQTTSQTLNIPNLTATDSLVLAASAQELSNKTLVDPVVKTGSNTTRLQTTTGNTAPGATIVLNPNNASRTLDLSGNLTLGANLTTNAHNITLNAISGGSTVTLPSSVNLGANLTTNSHALTINSAPGGSTVTLPTTVNIGANLTTNSNNLTVNAASGGSTLTLPPTANFSGGNVSTSGSITIGANFTTNSHALTLNAASGGSIVNVPASGTLLSMTSNLTTLPNTGNTTINHTSSAELTFGSNISKVIIANNLEVQGTTTTINTTNLAVTDNNITLNNNGTKSSAAGAGLTVDSSGDSSPWTTAPALLYNDTLTSGWELRKGDGVASELMTAARTLVRNSYNYGSTTTFNSSGGHSLVVQVSGNDRLRLESTNTQLQVANNILSVTDTTITLSTSSGIGNLTLTTTAGATTGNISLDSTAAGGTGNISVNAKGTLTLTSTGAQTIQGSSLTIHSSTPVTVNNDTGNIVRTNRNTPSSAVEIGTTNNNRVDIFTNNVKRAEFPSNPTADGEFRISGTRALRLPVGNDSSERPTTPATGMMRFNTTSNKFEGYNGTAWSTLGNGSGQGGINYIDNSDAEDTTTTGWVTYTDPAANTPVDGTGGTANVTFTNTSSSPVRGTRSFLLSKDAANRQGEGASYNFTIDPADIGKQLTISLDYRTSANYVAGDVRVFIYDVTNSTLLYPAVIDLPKYDTAGAAYNFKTSFVSSTSTSYRLIFHVATTSTSAYDIRIDNIRVGPDQLLHSSPVTELQTYTPTFSSGFGTVTNVSVGFRRVGEFCEIQGRAVTGTVTANPLTITLPPGLVAASTVTSAHLCGEITTVQSSALGTRNSASLYYFPGSNLLTVSNVGNGTDTRNLQPVNGTTIYTTGVEFSFFARVPIAQWVGSTVSVDNSQVEYLYNSSGITAAGATDTTAFAYGPEGAVIGAINSTTTGTFTSFRVRCLTPIQPTDKIDLQLQLDGKWVDAAQAVPYQRHNNTHTGVRIQPVSGSNTDITVEFGNGGVFPGSTYGATGLAWSVLSGGTGRWRVVKSRNPLTIGGLTGTLWQQKFLTSSFSSGSLAEITALRFNNLEIGKTYRVTYNLFKVQSAGSNSEITTVFAGGTTPSTNRYALFTSRRSLTSGSYATSLADMQYNYSLIFVAETSTLYTYAVTNGCSVYGEAWSPEKRTTNVILEELPLHQQTSKWT